MSKATADAEQLVADKAAEEAETIMVEVVDEEVRKAALWADEECKAELRRQYEVRVAAQAVAQAEAEAAAADAAAARAAHISAQAAAQLDEINSKTTGPKVGVLLSPAPVCFIYLQPRGALLCHGVLFWAQNSPFSAVGARCRSLILVNGDLRLRGGIIACCQIVVPDADTPGFRLRAQVVGEAEPRVLLLERGDAATIGEVKAALGQQGAGLDPAQLIIFAGGRMLQDAMTLRKCRIKVCAGRSAHPQRTNAGGGGMRRDEALVLLAS